MRFAFIDEEKANWPIEVLCDTLEVSSSGFYSRRRAPPSVRWGQRQVWEPSNTPGVASKWTLHRQSARRTADAKGGNRGQATQEISRHDGFKT